MIDVRRCGAVLFIVSVLCAALLAVPVAAHAATYKPVITRVSPNYAYTPGGRAVTVSGYHFQNLHSVYFGIARSPSVRIVSSRQLVATAPHNTAGVMHVHVYTAAGASAVNDASRFTVRTLPPVITGLSVHAAGTGGVHPGLGPVTVTGRYLSGATAVLFGTVPASSFTIASEDTIRVTVPAHPVGAVHVRVTTPGGTSLYPVASAFAYYATPVISYLTQVNGPAAGGNTVTLVGSGFDHTSQVTFAGVAGTGLDVVSSSLLTVTAPPHAAGPVAVYARSSYGNSSPTSYRYGAANTVQWSAPVKIEQYPSTIALSCPTSDFCAATDHDDNWLNETGGTWTPPTAVAGGSSVSCAAATFCMSVAQNRTYGWDGRTWALLDNPFPDGSGSTPAVSLTHVSCTSSTFCLVSGDGMTATWDGTSWSALTRPGQSATDPGDYVYAISCWADGQCAGATQNGVDILAGGAWQAAPGSFVNDIDSFDDSMSCVSATACQLGLANGTVVTLTPSGFVTTPDVLPPGTTQVACTAADSCVVTGGHSIATWDGTDWSVSAGTPAIDGPGSGFVLPVTGLSCPAANSCTAVGSDSAASFTW